MNWCLQTNLAILYSIWKSKNTSNKNYRPLVTNFCDSSRKYEVVLVSGQHPGELRMPASPSNNLHTHLLFQFLTGPEKIVTSLVADSPNPLVMNCFHVLQRASTIHRYLILGFCRTRTVDIACWKSTTSVIISHRLEVRCLFIFMGASWSTLHSS